MDVEKNQRMIEFMKQNSYGYDKTLSKGNPEDGTNKLSNMYKKAIEDVSNKTNQEKTALTDEEIDEEIEKYGIFFLSLLLLFFREIKIKYFFPVKLEEDETFDEEVFSPLHVLLYGLAHHEVVDCRSVVTSQSQHHVSTMF